MTIVPTEHDIEIGHWLERASKLEARIAAMIWTRDQMVWRRCDGEGRPQSGEDQRCLVWLVDGEDMAWIGIRVWSRDGWMNNNRPESATVTHWMPLPKRPQPAEEFALHDRPAPSGDSGDV